MFQSQLPRSPSLRGSLKALEADIDHANTLTDAIQRAYGGACIQMRLSCSPLAPCFLFLSEWLDCTCSYSLLSYLGLFQVLVYKVYVDDMTTVSTIERRASIGEFYAIIYPSLQQLESNLMEIKQPKGKGRAKDAVGRKLSDKNLDREDECGICLETCSKMVLPNCNHAMCIKCYRDWGSLKRVRSTDLWVLTNKSDVLDTVTLEMDNGCVGWRTDRGEEMASPKNEGLLKEERRKTLRAERGLALLVTEIAREDGDPRLPSEGRGTEEESGCLRAACAAH